MKKNNISLRCSFPAVSIFPDNSLVSQEINEVSIHEVQTKFILVSNEIGYFNKLTNFIVGNENSILFSDENGEMVTPTIKEVIKYPKKYFMLYPIPAYNIEKNLNIEIEIEKKLFGKVKNERVNINLDFEFGYKIGKTFANYKSYNDVKLNDFEIAINGSNDPKYFWPDKNIIINSNIEFNLGVLFGYIDSFSKLSNSFLVHEKDNIYIFATILNYFGASYNILNINKITDPENTNISLTKKINFKLPSIFRNIIENLIESYPEYNLEKFRFFIKNHEWLKNDRGQIRRIQTSANQKKTLETVLNKNILEKGLLLVPMTSFKFYKHKEEEDLYDLVSNIGEATNYALPFTPILKNSDGDILTLSTVFGKEALEDAKSFAPASKEWFRNLNDGSINKYIKDDALLGLYALTKHLG